MVRDNVFDRRAKGFVSASNLDGGLVRPGKPLQGALAGYGLFSSPRTWFSADWERPQGEATTGTGSLANGARWCAQPVRLKCAGILMRPRT